MNETSNSDYTVDDIQQHSHPVPKLWSIVFIGSLAFSPLYLAYFHGGAEGRTAADYYDLALAEDTRKQFEEIGTLKPDTPTIAKYLAKDNWLRVGKVVFKKNCIACHGKSGEGKIGPNLTDEKFKNIRSLEDVATVILKGANNNAMPAWNGKLHPNEIVLVSAYVASLRGTNVSGGKAGEGSKIAPWPQPPAEQPKPDAL